jgi:magnesium transporter
MPKKVIRTHPGKIGAAPGSLIHVGEQKVHSAQITLTEYNAEQLREKSISTITAVEHNKADRLVRWVNVDGIHQVNLLESCGTHFNLHSLVLEDILNTGHRPKFEEHDDYLFLVLKMLFLPEAGSEVQTEQISLIVKENLVLSFQERSGDVFDGVRERIRNNRGRIRKRGADYLAYALLDSVIDNYFVILEKIGEEIEGLQEELIFAPTPTTLQKIHNLKREMILLRKSVWPLRELISGMQRCESTLIARENEIFFKDIYDHTIQVIDTVETFRDILSGMLDLYLSSISNRMNEIMKVLTIMATIFIPLTFIAGIYGMNFDVMPELHWPWGYAAFWIMILFIAGGMALYFRKKNWL